MEGMQKFIRGVSKDVKFGNSGSSESSYLGGEGRAVGVAAALSGPEPPGVLVTRNPRQSVSLWTCSKLCAFFFVAGIFVGYTLKRRVRRWASRLLKRMKDD
ncbi:uncharacterized protein LOC116204666 isoform X2 [Punica granatum]|uniref:Uncharacterized protein LOC116204666 isoform X2 n=1 Tax=Punica granatum TaxID=22663 RepID=A0A6P8D7Y9_PUNGR|nr:uncharacterized protein LOC116204666 isoform X2 [Punica granatum]